MKTSKRGDGASESWKRANELAKLTGMKPGRCRSLLAKDPGALDRAKKGEHIRFSEPEQRRQKRQYTRRQPEVPKDFTITELMSAVTFVRKVGGMETFQMLVEDISSLQTAKARV